MLIIIGQTAPKLKFVRAVVHCAIGWLVMLVLAAFSAAQARTPVMVRIDASVFTMGRDNAGDESPAHRVALSAYQLGKYDVTNADYAAVLNWANPQGLLRNADGTRYSGGDIYAGGQKLVMFNGYEQIVYTSGTFSVKSRQGEAGTSFPMDDHPMVNVTWFGAVAFCNWQSLLDGCTPCYDLATWQPANRLASGYRLPTEAEWERAATGGDARSNNYGNGSSSLYGKASANYRDGNPDFVNPMGFAAFPYTSPVGWFNGINISPHGNVQTANGASYEGCYDLCGNVWNWCEDWYGSYSSVVATNPSGPASGPARIIRGGGWSDAATYCRSKQRHVSLNGDLWYHAIGFRVAQRPDIEILGMRDQVLHGNSLVELNWRTNPDVAGTAVRIELWSTAGVHQQLGNAWAADGNGKTQLYIPPLPNGSTYYIRITSIWNSSLSCQVQVLGLVGSPVRLLTPAVAAVWPVGSKQTVAWVSNRDVSGTAVEIGIWWGGERVALLATGYDASGIGATTFTVPNLMPGAGYKVVVSSLINCNWEAESAEFITIPEPTPRAGVRAWKSYP